MSHDVRKYAYRVCCIYGVYVTPPTTDVQMCVFLIDKVTCDCNY